LPNEIRQTGTLDTGARRNVRQLRCFRLQSIDTIAFTSIHQTVQSLSCTVSAVPAGVPAHALSSLSSENFLMARLHFSINTIFKGRRLTKTLLPKLSLTVFGFVQGPGFRSLHFFALSLRWSTSSVSPISRHALCMLMITYVDLVRRPPSAGSSPRSLVVRRGAGTVPPCFRCLFLGGSTSTSPPLSFASCDLFRLSVGRHCPF
jgi:hypothetical protein